MTNTLLFQEGRVYDEWRYENQPTIADVMDEFKSVNFPPSLLLSQLPLLQPRYYSISCSSDVCPGNIDISRMFEDYIGMVI